MSHRPKYQCMRSICFNFFSRCMLLLFPVYLRFKSFKVHLHHLIHAHVKLSDHSYYGKPLPSFDNLYNSLSLSVAFFEVRAMNSPSCRDKLVSTYSSSVLCRVASVCATFRAWCIHLAVSAYTARSTCFIHTYTSSYCVWPTGKDGRRYTVKYGRIKEIGRVKKEKTQQLSLDSHSRYAKSRY